MIAQHCAATESALNKHWPDILRRVRKEIQRRDRRAAPPPAPHASGHATRTRGTVASVSSVDAEMAEPQQLQPRGRDTNVAKDDTHERYSYLIQ